MGGAGSAGAAGMGGAGAGAGGVAGAGGAPPDGGADGPITDAGSIGGTFTLTSPTLKMVDGGLVFPASASAPMNQSPELHWTSPPADTASFALTIYDATAQNTHFVLYDIDKSETMLPAGLPRGASPTMPVGASWKSAFGGMPGYEGPGGGGVNKYEIVLWALKVAKLDIGTMDLNSIHSKLLPAQSLGTAEILAKGTKGGL
jgi:phosphatidylethanolamine-binding protein (PEBP) family uncharacterized protein